jgi:hypothetical protein
MSDAIVSLIAVVASFFNTVMETAYTLMGIKPQVDSIGNKLDELAEKHMGLQENGKVILRFFVQVIIAYILFRIVMMLFWWAVLGFIIFATWNYRDKIAGLFK